MTENPLTIVDDLPFLNGTKAHQIGRLANIRLVIVM